jgi:proline racemase
VNFPTVTTVDYHACGEPFRIVPDPPVPLPGATVADRRSRATRASEARFVRDLLALEPRGHRDMFGGFVVPPDDSGAHLGVLFWSQDGFAAGCGHGTMAIGTWAVQTGHVPIDPSGLTDVVIDVPSGRVTARVRTQDGRVIGADFLNVPSFVIASDVALETSRGVVVAQIAFGGASYAHVEAASMGLSVNALNAAALADAGREIRQLINDRHLGAHPEDPRIDELQGVVLFDRLGQDPDGNLVQRNVVVYGDAQIDRSPCGTGTSSRLAVLWDSGELTTGQTLIHHSIVGSTFTGSIAGTTTAFGREAVMPVVAGSAHRIGSSVFEVDPNDALVPGFRL